MKTATCFAALSVAVLSCALAADVNVVGSPTMNQAPAAASAQIASKDVLNQSTGLLNKNTLAMDNNVFVTKSNIVFAQNDRLAMEKKVEQLVQSAQQDTDVAVLSKNVLKAVSAPTTDAALMTKASAVVTASRSGDQSMLSQRIADLVRSTMSTKMEAAASEEQAIQAQAPRGVIMLVGTKDILRQPSAVVNKNSVLSDNQITISRSQIAPTSNDVIRMDGGSKVASAIASGGSIAIGSKMEASQDMRMGFLYQKTETGTDQKMQEQWGLWGGGWGGLGFGWRYPLSYWNLYGAGLGGCGLGRAFGPFYYC